MTPGRSSGKAQAGGTPGAARGEEILPRVLRGARPCISTAQAPGVVPTACGNHGDGNLPRGCSRVEGLQMGFKPFQTRSNVFQEGEEEREGVRCVVIPQLTAPRAAVDQPTPPGWRPSRICIQLASSGHPGDSAQTWAEGRGRLVTQGEDPDPGPGSSPFIADGLLREEGQSVVSVTRTVRIAQRRAEGGVTRPEQCSVSGPDLEGGRPPCLVKAEGSLRGRLIFQYN